MSICNSNKKLQTHRNKALKDIMCIVKVTGLWLREKHLDKDKQPQFMVQKAISQNGNIACDGEF